MYYNFLITGHGRSGTRFLSQLMNRSKLWTVLHEPRPKIIKFNTPGEYQKHLAKVQRVFAKDYYGEVNSMRRRVALDLKVAKKGVILRNPVEIYLSTMNRKGPGEEWLREIEETLHSIDRFVLSSKFLPIYFNRMTTDVEYCQGILNHFGIMDVRVQEDDIKTKVNQTQDQVYTLQNLSQSKVNRLRWFVERYKL